MIAEQVETLLKTQEPAPVTATEISNTSYISTGVSNIGLQSILNPITGLSVESVNPERWRYNGDSPQAPIDNLGFPGDLNMGMGLEDSTFTWEMIGLGLEEPLPPQETIDELYVCIIAGNVFAAYLCELQTSNIL